MKAIVVTGGIGAGKSTVCAYLQKRGIPVYDSDSRAKGLYKAHPELAAMVYDGIFASPSDLGKLEAALYPVLLEDFNRWAEESGAEYVAFESAVILQKRFFDNFGDYVLLVSADEDLRMKRALERGNVPLESLQRRMALQSDQRDNPRVDYVVENTASVIELEASLDKFLDYINYGKRKD